MSNVITKFLPSRRKKPEPLQTGFVSKMQEIKSKWDQRDLIIKEEFKRADYLEGDLVRPVDNDAFAQYGLFTVRGIVKSYHTWPKHEAFPEAGTRPMIVLIVNDTHSFNCTVNYVRKATPEEIEQVELKEKLLND